MRREQRPESRHQANDPKFSNRGARNDPLQLLVRRFVPVSETLLLDLSAAIIWPNRAAVEMKSGNVMRLSLYQAYGLLS